LTINFFCLNNLPIFPAVEETIDENKRPFFDLAVQFKSLEEEIKSALDEVFAPSNSSWALKCRSWRRRLPGIAGLGLQLESPPFGRPAFIVDGVGIATGDEVLLPPFTFFATAGSVSRLGATPVFVDIDPKTYNIDPFRIEEKISPRTKAIIPVHLFGQCADMGPLLKIAKQRKLFVIEDAAQALGADYQPSAGVHGRRAGQMGDLGCFSFYPTKIWGLLEMPEWW